MKKSSNNSLIKLMEKFDQQLHDLLMNEPKTIRSVKVKMLNKYTFKPAGEQLMTA